MMYLILNNSLLFYQNTIKPKAKLILSYFSETLINLKLETIPGTTLILFTQINLGISITFSSSETMLIIFMNKMEPRETSTLKDSKNLLLDGLLPPQLEIMNNNITSLSLIKSIIWLTLTKPKICFIVTILVLYTLFLLTYNSFKKEMKLPETLCWIGLNKI